MTNVIVRLSQAKCPHSQGFLPFSSITASHCNANVALQNLLEPSGAWRGLLGSPGSSLGAAWCCFMPLGTIWGSAAWTECAERNTLDGKGSECHFLPRGVPCVVIVLMWREGGWEWIHHHWTILTCLDRPPAPPPAPRRHSNVRVLCRSRNGRLR